VAREAGRPAHVKPGAAVVGIDAGVTDLIVVADCAGNELARHRAPRELQQAQRKLRALHRKAARQVGPFDEATRSR
jgi:putative transposase